ncbi:CocE/NonD family hydrolase [Nannocystis sp. SCPEA4]|uniref:CocE/NonD family hydrolase n=1 Tax=Nannocystis sp. SCPEA4 TaxID=2996787 RepID=UPI002271C0B4|nr:CocE/NonD family hydrolase [Nannocystis sp. SCPEA4]MCY1060108.1 CocE/NonD family hydrolase [Nannocystis sp. SCPEA4]
MSLRSFRSWNLLAAACLAACGGEASEPTPLGPGRHSIYVTAADGTRLAADVWLPADTKGPVPTMLRLTRYWRATEYLGDGGAADQEEMLANLYVAQGLAVVAVDARGTGASFGVSTGPWNADERADGVAVLDWIVDQPWSNGQVVGLGVSYEGNTAALIAASEHPAVKAVVTRFHDHDPFAHLAFPGGIANIGFMDQWSAYTAALDRNDACTLATFEGRTCPERQAEIAGPRPVLPDDLAAALAEHADNLDLAAALTGVAFKDDPLAAGGESFDAIAPYRWGAQGAAVPTLLTASWMDGGTAAGALDAWASQDGPMIVEIGAYSHGGIFDCDPLRDPLPTADPAIATQYVQALQFLGEQLGGAPAPARELRYVTLGEGTWRTTTTWPPPSVTPRIFALDVGGSLHDGVADAGEDTLVVDGSATTGRENRWLAALQGTPVRYPDRADAPGLLSWTTEPLDADTRVTGTPVVRLQLRASAADASVFVYLEDVDDHGATRYVTEGQLRLLHRATGDSGPGRERVTGRTYRRADARDYAPGELVELVIPLLPTSARIAAGHRIRLSLAGGDADTFAPITPDGATFTVLRGPAGSTLELPVDGAP